MLSHTAAIVKFSSLKKRERKNLNNYKAKNTTQDMKMMHRLQIIAFCIRLRASSLKERGEKRKKNHAFGINYDTSHSIPTRLE